MMWFNVNLSIIKNCKELSAEKTISFQVGIPEKFKTLTIPDTNVIDIISCVDSNNNKWYEVDFLAQDKVPIERHYTDDINRDSAYDNGRITNVRCCSLFINILKHQKDLRVKQIKTIQLH